MAITFSGRRRRIVTVGAAALLAVAGVGSAAAVQIDGTPGDDVLEGTAAGDQINGLEGDDLLRGKGGHDELKGGLGADVLKGGSGHDRLFGGPGNDELHGSYGPDYLQSYDPGFDRLFGGGQADSINIYDGGAAVHGGPGDDFMLAAGAEGLVLHELLVMHGNGGSDHLYAEGNGEFRLYGGHGGDYLRTYAPETSLVYGGPGNDGIYVEVATGGVWAGNGDDYVTTGGFFFGGTFGPLVGGPGDDTLDTQNGTRDVIRCGPGHDTVLIDIVDRFVDCEVIDSVRIDGDDGDNVLIGTRYNDIIDGRAGNDQISGRAGDDTLYPSVGHDQITGGTGDDLVDATESGGLPAERDTVSCGAGVDTVYADTADVVAADCENVTIQATAAASSLDPRG